MGPRWDSVGITEGLEQSKNLLELRSLVCASWPTNPDRWVWTPSTTIILSTKKAARLVPLSSDCRLTISPLSAHSSSRRLNKTSQVIISVHSLGDKRAFSALIWALKATYHALSMCPLASSLERRLSPLWLLKCAVSFTTCLAFSWKSQQLLIYPPSFRSSLKDSMSQIGVRSSVPSLTLTSVWWRASSWRKLVNQNNTSIFSYVPATPILSGPPFSLPIDVLPQK